MTRRRKGGSDSHFYYKWLDKALCDLQCARLLLTYGGDAYNIAFHCQQAIEKALKGYLLYRTGRHFDGHNLTYLCRQAIRLDPDGFSEYLDESAALNDLYIETRYPTDLHLRSTRSRSGAISTWPSACSRRSAASSTPPAAPTPSRARKHKQKAPPEAAVHKTGFTKQIIWQLPDKGC